MTNPIVITDYFNPSTPLAQFERPNQGVLVIQGSGLNSTKFLIRGDTKDFVIDMQGANAPNLQVILKGANDISNAKIDLSHVTHEPTVALNIEYSELNLLTKV